jgi:hypothetical protein
MGGRGRRDTALTIAALIPASLFRPYDQGKINVATNVSG